MWKGVAYDRSFTGSGAAALSKWVHDASLRSHQPVASLHPLFTTRNSSCSPGNAVEVTVAL